MLAIALRILTVATFFLGLGLFTGTVGGELWRGLHLLFGVGIVVLAILVLGPWVRGAATAGVMGRIAWWSPLVAIALGLLMSRFVPLSSLVTINPEVIRNAHIIAGVAVVGLIEIALGQMRRAANAAKQEEDNTLEPPA